MFKSVAIHARSTVWTQSQNAEELTIDSDDLAEEITHACNKLEKEGYEIITIVPLTSGNILGGTGYLRTESIIITARKKSH
jgi:hypothetical protein